MLLSFVGCKRKVRESAGKARRNKVTTPHSEFGEAVVHEPDSGEPDSEGFFDGFGYQEYPELHD